MGKRRRLSDEDAIRIGCEPNRSKRYRLSLEQIAMLDTVNDTITVSNDYKSEAKPFILSAWNDSTGLMMDIDEYCQYYKLPRKDISSYKLISHTGTPYYNIVFKELIDDVSDIDFHDVIDRVLSNFDSVGIQSKKDFIKPTDMFTRLVYTDTHIGMDTDSEGISMYPEKWDRKSVDETVKMMCLEVLNNKNGDTLYIDDLGDLLDGWNGETVRGGHKLPQNMTNEEAFEVALNFKIEMLKNLSVHFNYINCHNVCNDNHSGSFGAILNHAFKEVAHKMFNNVTVINFGSFIGHYCVGRHAFVLTHGKDKKNLKFGFKPVLDAKQIEHIDHYLKFNEVYNKAKYIEFSKGDSHQFILDYSTAQDFDYFNYPALSPSSEWVQTNYKRGRRGFVIQHINKHENDKKIIPIFL